MQMRHAHPCACVALTRCATDTFRFDRAGEPLRCLRGALLGGVIPDASSSASKGVSFRLGISRMCKRVPLCGDMSAHVTDELRLPVREPTSSTRRALARSRMVLVVSVSRRLCTLTAAGSVFS